MRGGNDLERVGSLTVIEIRDGLQNVAAGVERFRVRDSTAGGLAGIQDDLGVDKYTGGDALI